MRSLSPALSSVFLIFALGSPSLAEPKIDFNRDIRPIFVASCTGCHGGVKAAGGVSFIYKSKALGEGKSGERIIVPGDPGASELVRRILTKDPDEQMPPPDEHPEGISDHEKALLQAWISQGAEWREHWSFEPPKWTSPPDVSDPSWPLNDIDRFVMAKLDLEGISPSPDAAPDLWLRRVTLDLTGLPPTPSDRAEFLQAVQNEGETAYAEVVQGLLDSPGFGERWASVWLDQVRYADSKGLGQDRQRRIWKYRDWVISALNQDLPFDQFTIKQIAGDLLPNATLEDRLATACHRLTQTNDEGGTDDEEFRVEALLDRVSTIWQTWQGVTFGCVQCHSHPYDPIEHDEFYQFAAFFNNTADSDLIDEKPLLAVPLATSDYEKANQLDNKIEGLRAEIWQLESAPALEEEAWIAVDELKVSSDTTTQVQVVQSDTHAQYETVGTIRSGTGITLEIPTGKKPITAIRFTGFPEDLDAAKKDSEWGFVISQAVATLVLPGTEKAQPVELARVVGDEPHPFDDPNLSVDTKSKEGFGPLSRMHYPRSAVFIPKEPIPAVEGGSLRLLLRFRVQIHGAFPLIAKRGQLDVSYESDFTELQTDPRLAQLQSQLEAAKKARAAIPSVETPILRERFPAFQRPTSVFVRGNFLTKDTEVSPGVPVALGRIDPEATPDRLALARWMVSPENPLTARVTANRYWARLFGAGLVASEEDFGSSGDKPSHPALLDYLAVQFQSQWQWSTKRLLREIVLSRTYRQSGVVRPELTERDPQNRLLAKGPRHRLPAETVVDQALFIGGLLSATPFGEPGYPPLPDGVWKPFDNQKWPTPAPGEEGRYRRSIYTYMKRSIPFPTFAAFDAPSREFCNPRRLRSNTPLQALMTLNDAAFDEAARELGSRLESMAKETDERNAIRHGFVTVTSRMPSASEVQSLSKLLSTHPGQGNSWHSLATVLLNLDEVFAK